MSEADGIVNEQRPPSLRRPLLWVLGILCAVYLPLFLGKIIFFRDVSHWGFPARAFLRESLLRGELPAWNPYQALGFPVMGDPLYGVFYPPNWLYLLVGPGWVASMFNWQAFLHLAFGAAGIGWLARRLGAGPRAITIAGLAWALSGYTTAQWTSGLLLLADAWVPWVVGGHVALLDSLRRGGGAWRRGLCKAALPTVGGVLLGEIFLAMIAAAFAMTFATLLHLIERRGDPSLPRGRPTWLVRATLAVVLAFGAGAVVIVPARALLGSTERSAPLPSEIAERCSLHPLRLVELVTPLSMGDPYGVYPAAPVIGEAKLDGLPLSYSVYLGASVAALALAAIGRKRRTAQLIGGLLLAGLALALGKYTPVYGIFRRVALPLAYMRYPEKYMVLVVAGAALLAGLGGQRLLATGPGEPQPWRRNAFLLATLLLVGVLAHVALPPLWSVFAIHGAMMGGVAVIGVLAVHFLATRGSRLAGPLLVTIVALDLAAAVWPLQGFGGRSLASAPPPAARVVLARRASPLAPPRIYRSNRTDDAVGRWLRASTNTEGESRAVQTLITNTANAWGIATLPGYDAAIAQKVERVWTRGLDAGQATLRFLGAEFVVLPVADPAAPPDDHPGLTPIVDPLPGSRLYAVPDTLPRVFLARHAEVVSDEVALDRLFEPAVVQGASVWLAPAAGAQPLPAAPGRAGSCSLESYEATRVVARCAASEPALAVFVEQFERGWQATLDGRPAPILRANLIMRALAVSPGRHRIVLEYRTPGLAAGATISLLCLGLLGALWIAGRPRQAPVRG